MSTRDVLQRVEVGEGTPLVQEPLPRLPRNSTFKDKVVTALAALGFTANLLSTMLSPQPSVFLSAVLGMLLSPYAIFQMRKLSQVRALKETNTRMQEEVGRYQYENMRLQHQEEELAASVVK